MEIVHRCHIQLFKINHVAAKNAVIKKVIKLRH